MKRILYLITNTQLGGAQRVCIDLANKAVKEGYTVAVASMVGGYLWDELDPLIEKIQLKHMKKELNLIQDLLVLHEIKRIRKTFVPDIVHLHSSIAGVLGRIVFRKKTKIIYTVHGFDSIRLRHRIFLPLERYLQKYTNFIVPVSNYDKINLEKEGITKNVVVIYNGIKKNESFLNLDSDSKKFDKVVLSIARISKQKKFDLFVEVAKKFQNVKFIWIGGANELSDEGVRLKYNLPDNLLYCGNLPNASCYINCCDIFTLFSNYEGLPMTIIEAMSNAKPIVASDVGGVSELVTNNGYLVSNDIDEICDRINSLLDDNYAKKLGSNSYINYEKTFTLEKMWENYNKLYCQ